ncbi:RodZ domain-containing protein [Massilia niastensis]|uniref:RodZ domain-containing protein n=1 Tax=Massilia niastensis TaxID=544911 RepID=UPI00037934D1|nr:RodZ domain-containing protein [Massilia niastensis]
MNEHADQPAAPGNNSGIPGKTLQSQRETLGWTVEQVADQLKLAPRQVVALEAGDYASLPSPAVTRGFVRAYAKLLKIDAAPLVAMIELNMPPQAQAGAPMARREQRPAAFNETRFPIGGKRNRVPLGWIAAAVVVAAAAAAAWQFGLIGASQPQGDANPADGLATPGGTVLEAPAAGAPASGAQEPVHNPSVPLISVPAPGGTAPATAPGAAPAAPATTPGAAPATPPATPPGAAVPGAAPASPAGVPPAAVPASGTAATVSAVPAAAGTNTLVLNVREDSWIEVRTAKDRRALIARLVKAGSTESFELAEPVNLVVGKPSAVSASLRGSGVELPLAPGKTYARVALK